MLDLSLRDDLELQDYVPNLTRMFDEEILGHATSSVSGEIRFFGLTPTNMKLDGIEKHQRLVESYEKLQVARHRHHASSTPN